MRVLQQGSLCLLFILISLISPVLAADTEIQECYQKAQQENRQLVNLKEQCPRVYHSLQKRGVTPALDASLPDNITLAQLKFLHTSALVPVNSRTLDESGLDRLLAGILIDQQHDDQSTWWKQFLEWLNSFKPEKYESEFGWLMKFLEAITPSEQVARIIMYIVFGITLLSAIGMVIWELYMNGVFSRQKGNYSKLGNQKVMPVVESKRRLSVEEIQQLAPEMQVVALYNNVISYLIEQAQLPGNPALTNFELQASLRKHKSLAQTAFASLVANVEPVLYGGKLTPTKNSLECCWNSAQQILKL